jgi:ribonucleoside-triphosphate reductase
MNIPIKVKKDFENAYNKISEEYGEDFELLNGFHESQLNSSDFIDNFIDRNVADTTIDANANASNKDIRSLLSEKGKSQDKLFAFNKIFYEMKKKYGLRTAKEWLECEYNGAFYLHDAHTATYMPYCYAYDLTRLATEGLFFLNKYNAKPPKHLTTFIDDVIEYISYMSNRSSGAVGIPNILIWTYYFWKKDCETNFLIKDKEYYLRQTFQKFVYRLNQPFMRIDQTAFVNVSIFDRNYLESLFGGVEYPDGSFVIDNVEELIEHQKIFMEVVSAIRSENMFTFPVLTYSLLYNDNQFVDMEFARWCSDHNTKWNDSNFFTSDNVGVLSNCCRLLSDTSKLDAFINSIGGTALSIGSEKVNTTNLMRIVLETGCDKKKYLTLLKKRITLCCKTLDVVRHIISRNIEKGLLPNYVDGGMELSKQYSTVGILGLYEVIERFGYIKEDEFGYKSYTDEGIKFASKIFETINEVKDHFTNEYSFNVESVPAERCAIVLCQKDNLLYSGNEKFIYSNQWIPLSEKCTIAEKVRLSSILDKKCSGGSIAHINIESNFPNTNVAWDMLNYIAKNGVMYFAFNSKINVCINHHGFIGTNICPECGEPVDDTYQRIVGYLVPSKSYSKDRLKEFTTRKWYEYSEMVRDL